MRVALIDYEHTHVAWVELPDNVKLPQTVIHDGMPFIKHSENTYKLTEGVFHTFTKMPVIDMAKKFDRPVVTEAMSTKWFSGCVGEAKLKLEIKAVVPWSSTMKIIVDETRIIRVNGVWSPDIEDTSKTREMRSAGDKLYNRWRKAVNEFCNEYRPMKSRLVLTMLGLDVEGRIVCDIEKRIPSLMTLPGEQLSLRKHLLGGGLFTPARWRMP